MLRLFYEPLWVIAGHRAGSGAFKSSCMCPTPNPEPRNPKPETRNPKHEKWIGPRNIKPEARNTKLAARSPNNETRSAKHETRNTTAPISRRIHTVPHPTILSQDLIPKESLSTKTECLLPLARCFGRCVPSGAISDLPFGKPSLNSAIYLPKWSIRVASNDRKFLSVEFHGFHSFRFERIVTIFAPHKVPRLFA